MVNSQRVIEAVQTLAESPNAVEAFDAQILALKADIAKLRRIRMAFSASSKESRKSPPDDSLVVTLLENSGPMTPRDIGNRLGMTCQRIGRIVASSTRLAKQGKNVVLTG